MGLRDFLMGAQQFQEGTGNYAGSAEEIRKQAGLSDFEANSNDIIAALRGQDEQKKSQALGQLINYANRGIISHDNPLLKAASANALPEKAKTGSEPFTKPEQLTAIRKDLSPVDAQTIIDQFPGDRKAQELAIQQYKEVVKEQGKNTRQEASIANANTQKTATSAEQFGTNFDKIKKSYDDPLEATKSQLQVFQKAPSKVSAVELSTKMSRMAGQVGHLSDQQLDRTTFNDLNSKWVNLSNTLNNYPDGPLPPEVVSAYQKLAQETIDAAESKRDTILKSQFLTAAAGHVDRLFKGDKKHPVLKTIESELGVTVKKDKGGILSVENAPQTHTGGNADLVNAANNIKNPAVKAQYLDYFNKNAGRQFTPDEVQHIKQKMAGQ